MPPRASDNVPIVTLLTDFGQRDHYVGSMKGVILQIEPRANVVDITHEVEPHNILQASFILRQIWSYYPPGTVHVVVVDPGVGSDRRIIAGQYEGQIVVAPDNGVISILHREKQLEALYVVENTRLFLPYTSNTFHGRDIFAPVAAMLLRGMPLVDVGPPTDHIALLRLPETQRFPSHITGEVLFIDHFGNLITNISSQDIASLEPQRNTIDITVNEVWVGHLRRTYSDVNDGEPIAFVGSSSTLEIGVNRGRANQQLEAAVGSHVEVRRIPGLPNYEP